MATPIWVNIAAPSHNLNQCWSIISEVPWHSSESKLTVSSQAIILYNEFENYAFKITAISPRGQWVKRFSANCMPFYLCPVLRVCTNEQISLATWWRHQMETFCVAGPFVRGISTVTGESPHKQWRRALMTLYSLSCASANGWENNRGTGDMRRPRIHYLRHSNVPLKLIKTLPWI